MYKILIVEDDEPNREMLGRRLEKKGYSVLLAVNGQEAVDMAPLALPDLILMDMGMPVMDGLEATRRLRSIESCRHIPIIAVTGWAMSGELERALEAGCDDYDTKPIDLQRLLGKITSILAKRTVNHTAASQRVG